MEFGSPLPKDSDFAFFSMSSTDLIGLSRCTSRTELYPCEPSAFTIWANTSALARSTASIADLLPNQATCTLLKRMPSMTPA